MIFVAEALSEATLRVAASTTSSVPSTVVKECLSLYVSPPGRRWRYIINQPADSTDASLSLFTYFCNNLIVINHT